MVLFLASEVMLFGSLFAAFFLLRNGAAAWPPSGIRLDAAGATLATVILAVTTPTVILARRALSGGGIAGYRWWICATFALGAAFLISEIHGWAGLDFRIDTDAFGSIYFALTGLHALHMIAGLVLLGVLLARSTQRGFDHRDHAPSEAVAYYWHFLFAMWLAIYATVNFTGAPGR